MLKRAPAILRFAERRRGGAILSDSAVETPLLDLGPGTTGLLEETPVGLREQPRQLPCKYLYDERGSQLLDRICELDEYYPTRCELSIMRRFAAETGAQIGPRAMLIELGSGSIIKTRLLLDQLREPAAYVPVEMHLVSQAEQGVTVGGESFDFAVGETIGTEYSHKYTIEGFARIAAKVGFDLRRSWTDDRRYFAVLNLVVTG